MIGDKKTKEIVYLQSQDGNIYRTPPRPGSEPQLRKMQDLIEPEIEWMRDAVGRSILSPKGRRISDE